MCKRRRSIAPILLLAGLACGRLPGCGESDPPVDPETRKIRKLSRLLAGGTMIERRRAADALAATADTRAVAPLRRALRDASPTVRLAAADGLVSFGPAAWEPLRGALADADVNARESAAYALGRLGDERAAELLRKAMQDEAPSVRAAAMESLGRLADHGSSEALMAALGATNPRVRLAAVNALAAVADPDTAGRLVHTMLDRKSKVRAPARAVLLKMDARAVDALAGGLKTADRNARPAVAKMLAKIGGPKAFAALADALKGNPDKNGSGDDQVVDALLTIGGEGLAEALLPALESPNARARSTAARFLAERGDRRAVPALINAFKADPSSKDVIEALAALKDPRAAEGLLEAFRDRSAKGRDILARALGDTGDARAAGPILAELKERWPKRDQKGQHRMIEALCGAAGKVGAAGAADLLIEATAYGRDSYGGQFIRAAAARSLGRLGEKRAIGALGDCTADAENRPASAACEALGHLKDPRSVPPLVKVLTSRYREVRSAAAEALVQLGPIAMKPLLERIGQKDRSHRAAIVTVLAKMGSAALGGLLEKLKAPDAAARQGAAWALGTMKDPQAFGPLVQALSDEDFEVRGAAVWALRELGDRRAVGPLIEALKDPNRRVRGEAITTLGSLGDIRAVGPLLPCLKDADGEVRGPAASALGALGDGRAVEPLNELIRAETEGLEGLLAGLKAKGKLTRDGRMVRNKPMTDEEKRAILTHRSTRSAARMALEKLGRQPAPREHMP